MRRRGRPAGSTNFSQLPSTQQTIQSTPSSFDRLTQREQLAHKYVAEGPTGGRGGRRGRVRLLGAQARRPRESRARGDARSGARGRGACSRGRGRSRGRATNLSDTSEAEAETETEIDANADDFESDQPEGMDN